ncbi:type VI secretion system membrane subunit TssM [Colwellia sp. MEBiC06753]
MDKLAKIVYSNWFLPLVIFIIFSLVVLLAGPYLAFAEYYPLAQLSKQIVLIVFVLLVYTSIKFFQYHRSLKVQRSMVSDMTDEQGVGEIIDAEKKALKEKFEQALNLLKQKKGNKQALTEMPWYMIIGNPGSGKTTLLSNSGLQFPLYNELSNQALQGVGGTKNCDWWITQEAILLDTAGRYASQDSHQKADESGWMNFLNLIKRYRRKPISGLLVSFSMSDLLTMNDFELGQQLIQIKQRIADLNKFFDTRFPVYVVITKSDMLAGFSQFYESFSSQEREQTFGITFEPAKSDSNNISQQFSQKFTELHQSLTRRQWQRTALERDPSRKSLIFSFANQFGSLKPTLDKIIQNLSSPEDNCVKGIVRGLYFTSGTQNGAPIDRMMAKVAQTFGLKNKAQVLWNNDTRSYFIKDLLQKVVFPESDQFGVLAGYQKRQGKMTKIAMLVGGVIAIALSLAWLVSYSNNVGFIESSQIALKNWHQRYQEATEQSDIRGYLKALNDFSGSVSNLTHQSDNTFSGLGLSQTDNLGSAFNASYNRLITTALLPYVKKQIENAILQAKSDEDKYQALTAYLMFSQTDKRNAEYLTAWLKRHLNNDAVFNDDEYIALMVHVDHAVSQGMTFNDINDKLVAQTQIALQQASLSQVYYAQFKQQYLGTTDNMLSMTQLAGANWRVLMETSFDDILTISRLYTPSLFNQVSSTLLPDYLTGLAENSWVLGDNYQLNKSVLSKELLQAYTSDYITSWQRLLDSISIKSYHNSENAESALTTAGDIDSPLITLLVSVSDATKLVNTETAERALSIAAKNTSVAKVASRLDSISIDTPAMTITRQFSKLHELVSAERKTLTQQRFSALTSQLALSLASLSDENDASSHINALKAFAYSQPEPLKAWANQLADRMNMVINLGLKSQMASIWKNDIVSQCVNIVSDKFPFDKAAKQEASLSELAKLFADSGVILQFYQQHIQPLVNTNVRPWRWNKGIKEAYQFDDAVLTFFERTQQIGRTLFPTGGNQPRLGLNLKPLYLDPNVAKFKMEIYGNQLNYQFGRPISSHISWPPENVGQGASFSFVRRDGSEIAGQAQGFYGVYRLIAGASVNVVNSNKVEITFEKETYKAVYELTGDERSDPLLINKLSQFSCLNTL